MATSALRPCPVPGCPELVRQGRCADHARALDRNRPNLEARRWYQTPQWRALRAQVLHEEPCCKVCLSRDEVTPSTDVDHMIPHQGNPERFWDRNNLQGICKVCHGRKTRAGL